MNRGPADQLIEKFVAFIGGGLYWPAMAAIAMVGAVLFFVIGPR